MTNEEVMKLLTDMGLHAGGMENWIPDNAWVEVVNKVIAIEREACARVVEADGLARGNEGLVLIKAAGRIRARGQK